MRTDSVQIFGLPCAGGSAAFFGHIAADLPEYKVTPIEYPGHGKRFSESFAANFSELADDSFRKLCESLDCRTYALFGYSMGCIVAIELLRRILNSGMMPPECVILAAHALSSHSYLCGELQSLSDEAVKAITLRFGGIPEQLVRNAAFWRLYTPMYRADYELLLSYRYDSGIKTQIPALIFYAEADTPLKDVENWRSVFTGDCHFMPMEGTHFFINDSHELMAEKIRQLVPTQKVFIFRRRANQDQKTIKWLISD